MRNDTCNCGRVFCTFPDCKLTNPLWQWEEIEQPREEKRKLWNTACDYVINDLLAQFPKWDEIIPPVPKKYKGKTTEQIYDLLRR